MNSFNSHILLLAVLSMIEATSFAQSQYRFQHYDSRDGLASDEAWGITSDSLGYIWIENNSAVSRFDGYSFKVFQYDENDSARKALRIFQGVFTDDNGSIWLGEGKHDRSVPRTLIKYDWKADRFVRYRIDLNGGVTDRYRFEKNDSIIWICVIDRGLARFNIQTNVVEHFATEVEACKNIGDVRDYGSYLLLTTSQGLWKFDKSTHRYSRPVINAKDTALLFHTPLYTIMDNSDVQNYSGLWIKLDHGRGVIKIDSTFSIIKQVDFPEGILMKFYAWDKDEVVWFSNSGEGAKGIYRLDTKEDSLTNITHDPTNPYSLKSDVVNDLTLDASGNLWVATEQGLSRLAKSNMNFQNYPMTNLGGSTLYQATNEEFLVLSQQRSQSMEQGEQVSNILIAPVARGVENDLHFRLLPTNQVKGVQVQTYWKGKDIFWVAIAGTEGRVVGFPINPETGMVKATPSISLLNDPGNVNTISSFMCNAVWEDPSESLWVGHIAMGTRPAGLSKVISNTKYGKEGSVIRYERHPNDPNSLINNSVHFIFPEDEKSVWVSTLGGTDLVHFTEEPVRFEHVDKKHFTYSMYRTQDGLLLFGTTDGLFKITNSEEKGWSFSPMLRNIGSVLAISEDKLGRLWLCTGNRLICFDSKANRIVQFSKHDGIDHLASVHHAKDGRMISVSGHGFTVFDPHAFQFDRKEVLPLITSLTVNSKAPLIGLTVKEKGNFSMAKVISGTQEIKFDYLHNNFTLEFSSMEMTAPEKNRYRHKLEGYDPDWIESDYKARTATYTNLDAGTYTFRVKASNHHGVWSDNERTLKVIILPPPWKTWWAYSIYTLVVLGLLFTARRMIVQRERLKGSLKLEKVEREKEHFELEKAKEVDRVKTSFFTNISHEFRTPLTLIQGPVQDLLEKYSAEPKTKDKLKLVERNADLLLKLINQLLDLAKLDAGNLKIEKSKGEVMRFVKATSSSFSSLAAQKSISLIVDVPAEACYALFDRDKLETILINLINNAIKFTPSHGKVNVGAKVTNSSLLLNVSDTGIGIPFDQHEKIFERFHQVSESHKEVGTGIGLALVKELVSLLGGTIAVKSEVGKGLPGEQTGSEFIITLPLEIVSGEEHIDAHEQEISIEQPTVHVVQNKIAFESTTTNGGETRPHILVVEDNADLRSFIIESLGEEFHFLEAENGKQGLDVATTEIPDLIISDVMMPEMDGITMAEKIKTDVRTSHIPLILLTAKSTEASKLTGLESGADDYLTKPFNKQELLLKIRNGITRQRKLREKVMAELMSEAPRKEVLSADEQFLTKVKEEILIQLSNEQLSVESLAEQIGMSRVHLYRKISGLTGMSVNELIRKLRLHRAAQLLQQQWGPVSQVAYEVGFSNLSYFSKVFKEEFGVLPSEYSTMLSAE